MSFIISLIFTSLQIFGFEITEVNESRGVASIKGDNIHLEEKLFVSNTNGDICKAKVIKKQNNKVLVSTKNCSFRIGKRNRVSAYEGQLANNMNTDFKRRRRSKKRGSRARKRKSVYHGLSVQLGFERDQHEMSANNIQNNINASPVLTNFKNKEANNTIQVQVSHSLLFGHFEPFYSISYENTALDLNEVKQNDMTTYGAGIGLNYNFINLLKRRKKAPLVPYIQVGGSYKKREADDNVQTLATDLLSVFGGIGGKFFITRRTAINLGVSYNHALDISKNHNGRELPPDDNASQSTLGVTAALLVYL